MERVLVVEDADTLRDVLRSVLEHEGYTVDSCSSAEEAVERISTSTFSLVLSDFKLPGMNGIDLLKNTRESSPNVPFLMMTAYGSIDVAVEAMKFGANDFVCKPFEPEQLCSMIRDVIAHKRLIDRRVGRNTKRTRTFMSRDPSVLKILEQAKRVARFDSSCLILGESGTGKELLARYIHDHSDRRDKEFVSINCAAMPAELLESEFFGHEAGAFTGATQSRVGLLEFASEGTIFLDEVGDMPAPLQVKLLRALQEREIKRVGGNRNIKINPRLIAATNKDIEESINCGSLREDFYYRLAVMSFTLPPLRERKADIELLSEYFIKYFSDLKGSNVPHLSELAQDLLMAYKWPGNARELENVIERAVVLADNEITENHLGINLPLDVDSIEMATATLPEIANRATRKAEIDLILRVLQQTSGNKSRAAEVLGVSYKTLLNKIKEYQLV